MSSDPQNIDTTELVQLLKIQQEEIKRKNEELKEMEEIYAVYKVESEELEQVLTKQVDLFDEQLKAYEEKEKKNLDKYAEQLANQKIEHNELIAEYGKMVEALKEENYHLKQLLIDNKVDINLESYKSGQEKACKDVTTENVQKLNLELEEKNQTINELNTDIGKVKATLRSQHQLFNDMKMVIDNQKDTYVKQIQEVEKTKAQENYDLSEVIKKQDDQIKEFKVIQDKLEKKSENSEEVEKLQNLVIVQGNKLKQISKDFIDYRVGAEKLLEYEKLVRDTEIEKLQVTVEQLNLEKETMELKELQEQEKNM